LEGKKMKRSFLTLALIFSAANAHAAAILIDFNEVAPVYNIGNTIVDSKGYHFEALLNESSPPYSGVDANGIFAEAECFPYGGGCGSSVTMVATNGSAFAIHSIGAYSGDFGGTMIGGGSADLSVGIGTGDWLLLESFQVSSTCPLTPCFVPEISLLDDISVSAVPIPAAVWLFGSGLGLLGFLRRKKLASA